ncbi:MAG: mandelate racemase [Kofleriaceae bacterium]|nr:mandelate racemase [Kofleriaceae bacterium]
MISARIEEVDVRVFDIPTVTPYESDGTATWSSTTMVLVEVRAAGISGLGYSYIHAAAARLVEDALAPCLLRADALAIPELHARMVRAVRNHGRAGIAACAISAVDNALWDLKARLLDVPLSALLGPMRGDVPVYASGGFTSTTGDALAREIAGYVTAGHRRIKIKIGAPVTTALERARLARDTAGADIELMVDANGAFSRKDATEAAARLAAIGVVYFEEPVTSDDLPGLRLVRDSTHLSVAAGEYGYDAMYFRAMLEANAVDILQADATRCLGISGFLQADALCDAFMLPLSSHCAPALHAHAGRAARRLVHVEHFFDHVRIENMLFEGVPVVANGNLTCDWSRPGNGLSLRPAEAARFAA